MVPTRWMEFPKVWVISVPSFLEKYTSCWLPNRWEPNTQSPSQGHWREEEVKLTWGRASLLPPLSPLLCSCRLPCVCDSPCPCPRLPFLYLKLTSCSLFPAFFLHSFSLVLCSVPSAPLQPGKTQQVCVFVHISFLLLSLCLLTPGRAVSLLTLLSIKESC